MMEQEQNLPKKNWQPPKDVLPEHSDFLSGIGSELKRLREKKGLSISKLCKELSISRNSYSLMENGEVYFSMENFLQVLQYHKISPIKFFKRLKEA